MFANVYNRRQKFMQVRLIITTCLFLEQICIEAATFRGLFFFLGFFVLLFELICLRINISLYCE